MAMTDLDNQLVLAIPKFSETVRVVLLTGRVALCGEKHPSTELAAGQYHRTMGPLPIDLPLTLA